MVMEVLVFGIFFFYNDEEDWDCGVNVGGVGLFFFIVCYRFFMFFVLLYVFL